MNPQRALRNTLYAGAILVGSVVASNSIHRLAENQDALQPQIEAAQDTLVTTTMLHRDLNNYRSQFTHMLPEETRTTYRTLERQAGTETNRLEAKVEALKELRDPEKQRNRRNAFFGLGAACLLAIAGGVGVGVEYNTSRGEE